MKTVTLYLVSAVCLGVLLAGGACFKTVHDLRACLKTPGPTLQQMIELPRDEINRIQAAVDEAC